MVQQKLSGRNYEFPEPTLRREHTVRREKLSGESHGDRDEFQPEESEDGAQARKDSWSIQEDVIYRRHIEPRVQFFCVKRRIIPYSTEAHWCHKRRNGKAEISEAKTRFSCIDIAWERTEFCIVLQLCARIRSNEKILRKLFTQFSMKVQASTCCLVSRNSVSEKQNSSSKLQNSGEYEIVQTPDVVLRRFRRSVSQRRKPRETEKHEQKDLSPQAMLWKGNSEKGMKGGHKKGIKTKKERQVHFAALMDIRHIQKYEYIPGNVSKNNLKCGQKIGVLPGECSKEQSQAWEITLQWSSDQLHVRKERWFLRT